jgi:hypothetical protein
VDGAGVDVELFAEDVAEALGVEECPGADYVAGAQARLLLDDVGKDIDWVGRDEDDAVEAFGHEFRYAGAHDDDVAGEHVESRSLELAGNADGDDDYRTGRCVFVGSGEDRDGCAEGDGLLEVECFSLDVGFRVADEDDFAGEVAMEDREGASGSDVATANDRDACVR